MRMATSPHIVLVGLPGSGKSTVGERLARRLQRPWVDIDAAVEARLGRPVAAVFAELGEERFRTEEVAALDSALAGDEPVVISAGGGLFAQDGVAERIAARTTVIWLDADDQTLLRRIGDPSSRPLLGDAAPQRLADLRCRRAPAHGRAHLRIDTAAMDADAVAERAAAALSTAVRVGTDPAYLVTVAPGAAAEVADRVPATARMVVVIADRAVGGVSGAVAAELRRGGRRVAVLEVEGGEALKTWPAVGALLERCAEVGMERGDCIVAIGGGSVGDAAGFVAATYLRGVSWVVVPTTLLAMVDSAVGGKTGVNLGRGKNLAGAFWQPRAVLCDPDVLASLPERRHRSAFAEIVKSSMVGGGDLPLLVENRLAECLARGPEALAAVIRGCCALKAEIVGGDEREAGRRAVLNYGHTVGHAVEALTGYGNDAAPDHGEAVAFGMRVAGELSIRIAGCPPEDIAWQNRLLDQCRLTWAGPLDADAVISQLASDKKSRGGVPRWVLLEATGRPVTGVAVPEAAVRRALAAVGVS